MIQNHETIFIKTEAEPNSSRMSDPDPVTKLRIRQQSLLLPKMAKYGSHVLPNMLDNIASIARLMFIPMTNLS
jgi:hypothetical protein